MRVLQKIRNPFLGVPLLCALVYGILIRSGQTNYFRELAGAFLDGRLDLARPSQTHDLVFFAGKYYLYWPPVPALVFAPFVALFGQNLSDGLVSSLFGIANVVLLMQLCRRLSDTARLGLTRRDIGALGLFWAFGTVHFYMAKSGNAWLVSQVMAQTFLLGAVYALLRQKPILLVGGLFALACYTRNDLIFSGFFIGALHRLVYPERRAGRVLRDGAVFLVPFLAASVLNGWYNWARFGDAFENGLQYHLMDPYFRASFDRWGYFNPHYFPHNFYTEVLHAPTLIPRLPFIEEEPEGFGFLWASPLFFLLFPAGMLWIYRLLRRRRDTPAAYWWLTGGSLAAAVPIAVTIFLIMGTGWRQFGARYTLDFQFFCLVFGLAAWPVLRRYKALRIAAGVLLFLSLVVQGIGAG